jgi:hypothetical protein
MKLQHIAVAAIGALACAQTPPLRFDRQVLHPAEPGLYRYAKLHGLEVPELWQSDIAVQCLVYQDDQRIYVETVIRNRTGRDEQLAPDFLSAEAGNAPVARTNTVKMAEEIERAALKPFVPEATGRDPERGRPSYARDVVAQQAKRHIEKQEREITFAGMLVALAHERQPALLQAGQERVFACTLEQPKDHAAPLRLTIRALGETFEFAFRRSGR